MITRREANIGLLSSSLLATAPTFAAAQAAKTMELPPVETSGGKPLMQVLMNRRSGRDYADRPLSARDLSNLLWAAWGINRPASNGRTAPHWQNVYNMDIYLAMADGVWRYEPEGHRLSLHMSDDLRGATTTGQPFVATAPLNLIYACDGAKFQNQSEVNRLIACAADTAVVAENVYLYCASEGLASVFRESVDGTRLAQLMKLSPSTIILFCQSVGYPKA
jgi:nitroreductase